MSKGYKITSYGVGRDLDKESRMNLLDSALEQVKGSVPNMKSVNQEGIVKLGIKRLSESAIIPKYQSKQASGFDLHAVDNYVLKPGETYLISTGLAFDIPEGYEIQIRPRSGLSAKTGLRVVNSPGTVDSDYTGEVKIIMANTGNLIEIIDKGDRIAQAVLAPVVQAEIVEVDELKSTERAESGFGSTGR